MRQIDNLSASEIEMLELKGMLPEKLAVTNATVDYYEKRELENIREFQHLKAQHDELLVACKEAKEYLVPVLTEPGRTAFWKLVDAIKKCEAD